MDSFTDEGPVADEGSHQRRSNGLPVVLLTDERLAEILRGTDLPADHEPGRPAHWSEPIIVDRLATVTASNGSEGEKRTAIPR